MENFMLAHSFFQGMCGGGFARMFNMRLDEEMTTIM